MVEMANETTKRGRSIARSREFCRRSRCGQALLEFAIIAFVISAIVAGLLGILVLALGSFQNNIATESAGRVLDGHSVFIKENFATHFSDPGSDDYFDPTADSFQDLTARQVYRFLTEYLIEYEVNGETEMMPLYDERLLILEPSRYRFLTDPDDPANVAEIPELNRLLLSSYIFDPDVIPDGAVAAGAHRYPGAVVERTFNGETYQTVLVPILDDTLDGQPVNGVDRTFNVKPFELVDAHPVAQNWVAPATVVRSNESVGVDTPLFKFVLFYPSQPASMISFEVVRDEENRIVSQSPVGADDGALDSQLATLPSDYQLATPAVNSQFGASASRGKYGLGESFAFVTTVRPYRAVFETSALFRLGASTSPRPENQSRGTFKREIDQSAIPFPTLVDESLHTHTSDAAVAPFVAPGAYEDNRDQTLDFGVPVIFNDVLPRYFVDYPIDPPASTDNDFVRNVFQLIPDDDGIWRVSVAAEFERDGVTQLIAGHVLALRLYRNGVFEKQIDQVVISATDPAIISLQNHVFVSAESGDVLQVRVFTDEDGTPGGAATYDVRLTGRPETNWVSFERIDG